MTDKTILVIDDSATIRKLVDTHLSPLGYQVILAPNAEDGLRQASEVMPDLILLDHQLPGTTGHDVCCQLVEIPELRNVPVVISSTLRKKAYAEYIDLDNVVDMLPKPYTEELLRTTVANALETAAMIVSSQSDGTAIPEVIHQLDDATLSGTLGCFSLREVVDFLNNGRKCGVLTLEADRVRIRFHLSRGRIQGVDASGLGSEQIDDMVDHLPDSIRSLAPVLRMTIHGRSCAEVDGFVQLLDQKVLDPRLMKRLLRFQAAMLVRNAFEHDSGSFHFESVGNSNMLQKNLPLDISLLALLVEAAVLRGGETETQDEASTMYVRRAIRGQNLDRAGLSARHMKVLNLLAEPKSMDELVVALGWELSEIRQVLDGFHRAELIEQRQQAVAGQFVVFEPDAAAAESLRSSLEQSDNRYVGKVVRDRLALQLVLKRSVPHTLIFDGDSHASCQLIGSLFATQNAKAASVRRIAIVNDVAGEVDWQSRVGFRPHEVLSRPCTAELLFRAMDRFFQPTIGQPGPMPDEMPSDSDSAPKCVEERADNQLPAVAGADS